MANWNLPGLTDLYSNVLQYLKDRDTDVSRWFSTKFTAATNVADGTIRWNDTNKNWEIWTASTSTWLPLSSRFMIDVDKTDGYDAGTGPNNLLVLDASGLVGVANIPTTLTGKSADMVDGAHAQVAAAASMIPIRDTSGNVVGNITGNAAYATSAGNADTVDGAHAQVAAAAGVIAVRDANGYVVGNITGNAATATTATTASACTGNAASATTASSCTGNAASATTAAACTGNAATATNATNSRYVWNNGAYGGTQGNVEASAMYVAYAANAGTVGGENVTSLAQHAPEGRTYVEYARKVYDDGSVSGSVGWKYANAAARCAGCTWTCTSACTGSCSSCVGACNGACTSCTNSCTSCTNACYGSCTTTCIGTCQTTCTNGCGGCDGWCSTSA